MKKYLSFIGMAISAIVLVSCAAPQDSSNNSSTNPSNDSSSSGSGTQIPSEDFNVDVPQETPGDPAVESAIAKLRSSNYHVKSVSKAEIKYPNSKPSASGTGAYISDVFSYKTIERTYQNNGEKSVVESTSLFHGDLDKNTGQPITGGNSSAQQTDTAPVTYFRNDDGSIYSESIDFTNTVSKLAILNETIEGYYGPMSFDMTFKNPWDYISAKDITIENGVWNLNLDKADFLLQSYASLSGNALSSAVLDKDDAGNITGLHFTTIDATGNDPQAEGYFVRTNTYEVTYSEVGTASISHKAPFANDNPQLAEALTFVKDQFTDPSKRNFTYTKTFLNDNTSTEAYYSPNDEGFVYFAQKSPGYTNPQDKPYEKGDNYDFRVFYDNTNKNYKVQNYLNSGGGFGWASIAISGTALYTIDTFEGIGPKFFNLGPELFKPYVVDGKEQPNQYVIEEDLLQTAGEYFDNQMLGVHTDQFARTTKVVIDLSNWNNGQGSMLIHTAFRSGTSDINVDFTLSNIGKTTLPSYAKSGL